MKKIFNFSQLKKLVISLLVKAKNLNTRLLHHFLRIIVLLGGMIAVTGIAYAQDAIDQVDLKKIKQKKVRSFIRQQQKKDISTFAELETSVNVNDEMIDFMNYEKEYLVKEGCDFVWDNYRYSSQTDVWDLNKISFAFLFCCESESIIYANQYFYGLEEGQIFYLNLKIMNGFYNVPVAFKIMNVDPEKKLIEFSYLKGGKAIGKQSIQLEETEEGYTRIVHKSFVKSDSKFRDKYLYPYFHNKLINEFHSNMKKLIVRSSKAPGIVFAELK